MHNIHGSAAQHATIENVDKKAFSQSEMSTLRVGCGING